MTPYLGRSLSPHFLLGALAAAGGWLLALILNSWLLKVIHIGTPDPAHSECLGWSNGSIVEGSLSYLPSMAIPGSNFM